MEVPFKVSVGPVVLLQHLDIQVLFKVSLGSVVLLQHLGMQIPFKVSAGFVVGNILTWKFPSRCAWALLFCSNILAWKFPSRCPRDLSLATFWHGNSLQGVRGICRWQHLDMAIPFKVSVGSVVLLQHLDMEIPFKVSVGFVVLL